MFFFLCCRLLTIVLSATSSASSEDTPSTHEIGRISAEVFSDDDESSLLYRGICGVMMSSCLLALVCLFFLRCMVACMFEMLANAGQEMDSARDCKYKFSINLVKNKPEYRTNPVNYPFGIHFFILLFSMPRALRHKWLSALSLRIVSVCTSCNLLLLLRRLEKTSKI